MIRAILLSAAVAIGACSSQSSGPAAPRIALVIVPGDAPEGSPIGLSVSVLAGTVARGTLTLGSITLGLGLEAPESTSFTVDTWAPAVPPGGADVSIALDVQDDAGQEGRASATLHVTDVGKSRLFAMGWHMHLSDGFSADAFDRAMGRLVDAVKPDFAPDRPNLLVFPEHCGLVNILSSPGGTKAQGEAQLLFAFNDLADGYGPTLHKVADKYQVGLNRALLLTATDTMWRPFMTTFSRLARENHVFISAATDVADVLESSDPAMLQLFGDSRHPERTSAYTPADGNVYNQSVLFGPDGRVLGHTHKVNLVSLEQTFDFTPGRLEDVSVFDLPVGKLGVAISLDAFNPSYVAKIDTLGAQIVVQNDANDGEWCALGSGGDWQPREWMGSIFGALGTQFPHVRYDVCPMMTGNLYDVPFDGQTAITAKDPTAGAPAMSFVGVDDAPYPGRFLAVSRWVMDDPGRTNPQATVVQRRAILTQKSKDLVEGAAAADQYVESLLHADVDLN